jgi:hypothetical protein
MIIVEQKNPDTSYIWLRPIISDTIKFVKKSQSNSKYKPR